MKEEFVEVETVVLENEKEYAVIDTIIINSIKYIYLCSVEQTEEFCIRKLSQDEKEILGLETEEEYNTALKIYGEKHNISNS